MSVFMAGQSCRMRRNMQYSYVQHLHMCVFADFIPDTNAVLVRTIDSVSSTPSIASLAYSKNA